MDSMVIIEKEQVEDELDTVNETESSKENSEEELLE